jgi:4-hydroxy-2-oxoheptanedioate aldolase
MLKSRFARGEKALNGWCALPSPLVAEIVGRAGFDLVTVDVQHGLIDYPMALSMVQVLQGLPAPVLARVPWNEPGIIAKVLDAGFSGLICPMVNTEADPRAGRALCALGRALLRADAGQYGPWAGLRQNRQ